MSWLLRLCETYENVSQVESEKEKLLPISHIEQNAQVEVSLDQDGDFLQADVVPKENARTVIPCTESSAGRSGTKAVHHALMDKLQYLAGDYEIFGGEKGTEFHQKFMEDLRAWCASEFRNEQAIAVLKYLEKDCLIQDLINCGVLYCGEDGKLLDKCPDREKHGIFKVIVGAQSDAFVRFLVEGVALWQSAKLRQDYIAYYRSRCANRRDKALCYVKGEWTHCTANHPKFIRNAGDQAKLISANDKDGFTYRGRFLNAQEAVSIGYETSQKAHFALRYLLDKQGGRYGSRMFVAWNPRGFRVSNLHADSFDTIGNEAEKTLEIGAGFAERFRRALSGYRCDLENAGTAVILGVDAATPGRLSVTFYREMPHNELTDRVIFWHLSCAWKHGYQFRDGKRVRFYGAPSPRDIVLAAFGTEQNEKLEVDDKVRAMIGERLLRCMIDGSMLPLDLVRAAFYKVCRPQCYRKNENWEKVLSIACSLIKKYRFDRYKEEWTVELQNKEKDLSYLCGRLLAVANELEKAALLQDAKKNEAGRAEIRTTTAMRYFTKFSEYPNRTWKIISNALVPYIQKLGNRAVRYQKIMGEISAQIDEAAFAKAKNLDGRMALGFYAQQNDIYTKKEAEVKQEEELDHASVAE